MGKLIPRCCAYMLRDGGWWGVKGEQRVCPQCLKTWAWEDGAWWQGPKLKLEGKDE